ncbi:hypothetical protein ACFO26_09740 [Lactococcus nasutitermitis]|uniref:Uncharacterized protein n=1 Tax=Lactococcus nasutitermitis TaxID=1652957 RepID=A0ABV9JGK0_9LACT|nr:hypothetical protein [Lactococcus nasutitermitis]
MNILIPILLMFLGLFISFCGILILRNGKITKNKSIPEVYIAYFKTSFFGAGNKIWGGLILMMGLGFMFSAF